MGPKVLIIRKGHCAETTLLKAICYVYHTGKKKKKKKKLKTVKKCGRSHAKVKQQGSLRLCDPINNYNKEHFFC